jgi:hypothetical protein
MIPLVVPYTQLRPETRAGLVGEDAIFVDVSDDKSRYFWLLEALWYRNEGSIIVEHDIVVNPDTIASLRDCTEDWCGAPYQVGANIGSWLGCTKFSPALMNRHRDVFDKMESTDWNSLDGQLLPFLRLHGEHLHKHWPAVTHLNDCGDPERVLTSCPCGGPIRFEQVKNGPGTVQCTRCRGYVSFYPFG